MGREGREGLLSTRTFGDVLMAEDTHEQVLEKQGFVEQETGVWKGKSFYARPNFVDSRYGDESVIKYFESSDGTL